MAYICMSAQNAARPAHGEQPACGPWTLMRVRPPPSVRIPRAAAFPGSFFCETQHLVLRHALAADRGEEAPPSLEVEVAPVSASQLVKKGVY